MIPDQWQKAKDLFDAALNRSPDVRPRFLDENCRGDEDVRREVESLLANAKDAAGFLEQPAVGEVAEAIVGEREKLRVSQSLSHYKIIKLLGTGGMGEVYLAEDTRLNRQVALKLLPDYSNGNQQQRQRFLREAQAASALNHSHICTIYEIDDDGDTPFIAMEYIVGQTLDKKIKALLEPNQVVDIALQIGDALAEAHAHNIVHRDIKPANIIVTPRGQAKVLDFGLAKNISAESEGETQKVISQAGMIIGTASYMSPEQARGRDVDARSDIFSFGVVLYEMTAGKLPFDGENAMDVIGSILHKEPAPLYQLIPDVSPGLERLINQTLRKDRAERYQTMHDLLVDLKEIKQELEFQNKSERTASPNRERANTRTINATTADASQTTSSAEYVASEIKKHKSVFIAVLAILLVAIGGVGFWYFNAAPSNASHIESIAVLPFSNETGNSNVEYLSDGVTETLISSLSQLPNLNVKARSSVFRYKGKEISPQAVGADLNVQALLTGRVVQNGNDLTLYLSLVDARTGNQIWGKQYNRNQENLISLQTEIVRDISNKLKTKLSGADEQRLAKSYTQNAEAYQAYLKGRFHWNKRTPQDLQKSIEYFEQAIGLDPNYALAYTGLADAYSLLANAGAPPHQMMPKAREAVLKALSLDNNLAEAHTALGQIVIYYDYDFAGAEREHKRAIELNPNYATAHQWYSELLTALGRHEEALAEMRRALEIDPLSLIVNRQYGVSLIFARQYDAGLEQLKKTLELEPNFAPAHSTLSLAYRLKGNVAGCVEELAKYQELVGERQSAALMRESFARGGWQGFLRTMTGTRRPANLTPYHTAAFYAELGEKDKAFAELDKAYQNRETVLGLLKVDPRFDSLHDDPRLQDLLRRVGLPQ